ncbi:MAG: hypothetical protein ACYDCO_03310 [Armatimonadota bacterium]
MAEDLDERQKQRLNEASAIAFDLLIIALLVDVLLYRELYLEQSSNLDLIFIILIAGSYRSYRAGLLSIKAIEFLRLPLLIFGIGVVLLAALVCLGFVLLLIMPDALPLWVRGAISLPGLAIGVVIIWLIFRVIRQLDMKILRKVKAEEESEAIIYSDEIVDGGK